MFDEPDPPVGPETDDFEVANAPEFGFAGKLLSIHVELAGGQVLSDEVRPLTCGTLTRDELVNLHTALVFKDEKAFVYAAARYMHLTVPVAIVCVSIGAPHVARVHLEYHDPRDGLIDFQLDCNDSALDTLRGLGRRLFTELANDVLASTIAQLKEQEERVP